MLPASMLSTGMQFGKQTKHLTASKLLLVHPQEKNSHCLTSCKSHSAFYLCLLGHVKSSGLMVDLTWCSLLLKAPKLDQVAQGFGQSKTSNGSNSTASPGSQSQYLVTLTVKKFFPAFIGISLSVSIASHLFAPVSVLLLLIILHIVGDCS